MSDAGRKTWIGEELMTNNQQLATPTGAASPLALLSLGDSGVEVA